jgi:hypothetical protein
MRSQETELPGCLNIIQQLHSWYTISLFFQRFENGFSDLLPRSWISELNVSGLFQSDCDNISVAQPPQ